MRRIGGIEIRPADLGSAIRPGDGTTATEIALDVGPIFINVTERGAQGVKSIFIHLLGSFTFDRTAWEANRVLDTLGLQTEAAYFRRSMGQLRLAYGAHYDHIPASVTGPKATGHPVFHVQARGELDAYGAAIAKEYRLQEQVGGGLEGMLRNVRSASAQLDVFSVLLQIAADHLLPQHPTKEQKSAFNALRSMSALCGPLCTGSGAASEQAPPSTKPVSPIRCFRARHWYREL
ncbi:MAG TPA: hypothetical protein VJU82_16785 [Acidobacteriaceae bacterium]|nr:hypothetical protein [Acidobacteriaceae bacterium]